MIDRRSIDIPGAKSTAIDSEQKDIPGAKSTAIDSEQKDIPGAKSTAIDSEQKDIPGAKSTAIDSEQKDIPGAKSTAIDSEQKDIPGAKTATVDENGKTELLEEIVRVDRWVTTAAENGLFSQGKPDSQGHKLGNALYDQIVLHLKNARLNLMSNQLPECNANISYAIQSYSNAVNSASKWWRVWNIYALPIWAYLVVFLSLIGIFYLYWIDKAQSDFEITGINAVVWGAVGGILRGLWFLKDKVGDRRYRKAWRIYFISVPFLGALFGAIVYFIIVGGLLAFDPNAFEASSDDQGMVTEINTTNQVTETTYTDQQDLPGNGGNSSGQQQLSSNDNQTTGSVNTTQVTKNTTNTTSRTTALGGNQQPGNESEADDLEQGTLSSLAIIALAALAGFNWEWIVKVFKRVGEAFAPSDKGSFQGLLEDDITKLDR